MVLVFNYFLFISVVSVVAIEDSLRLSPSFGDIYGGYQIVFQGPSVTDEVTAVQCEFYDPVFGNKTIVEGTTSRSEGISKVICYAPFFFSTGPKKISLVLRKGNEKEESVSGNFYVYPPSSDSDSRLIVTFPEECGAKTAHLTFEWNSTKLGDAEFVSLALYKKISAEELWQEAVVLDKRVPNVGNFSLAVSEKLFQVGAPFDMLYNFGIKPAVVTSSTTASPILTTGRSVASTGLLTTSSERAATFTGKSASSSGVATNSTGTVMFPSETAITSTETFSETETTSTETTRVPSEAAAASTGISITSLEIVTNSTETATVPPERLISSTGITLSFSGIPTNSTKTTTVPSETVTPFMEASLTSSGPVVSSTGTSTVHPETSGPVVSSTGTSTVHPETSGPVVSSTGTSTVHPETSSSSTVTVSLSTPRTAANDVPRAIDPVLEIFGVRSAPEINSKEIKEKNDDTQQAPMNLLFSDSSLRHAAWRKACGKAADNACQKWYDSQPSTTNSVGCPLIEAQVVLDPRYDVQSDFDIPQRRTVNANCYRNLAGSDQTGYTHCCYYKGSLIPDWDCGVVARRDMSDYFSALVDDGLGYVHCCYNTSDFSACGRYFKRRPCATRSESVPTVLGAFGDPHISTFDGLEYTFNGYGEYWMLKSEEDELVAVQARMEPFVVNGDQKNGTIFSAFVFGGNNITKVQVQRSSSAARDLEVFVDSEQISFSNVKEFLFDDVKVRISESNLEVNIIYYKGISFTIHANSEGYFITTIIDQKFKGNVTSGLWGIFDGSIENDLTPPKENALDVNATLEEIHRNFGELWRVTEGESIFDYTTGDYATHNDQTFEPSFMKPNNSTISDEVRMVCEENEYCWFDYEVTGSEKFANFTKTYSELLIEKSDILEKEVVACKDPLPVENGKVNCESLLPNSILQYKCSDGFVFQGDDYLVCNANGTWLVKGTDYSPMIEPKCVSTMETTTPDPDSATATHLTLTLAIATLFFTVFA